MTEPRTRWLPFLPAGLWLAVVLAPPLNHDVAAVLEFSRRWLAGEALYRELLDVNPPLIFVLNLLPAALGHLIGPVAALQLCLLGWVALACRLALPLRPAAPLEAAAVTVSLPLVPLLAGFDVGQREWLMTVAALPYLLLAARRIDGPAPSPRLALAIAGFAALGFALKPHFLAIPALVELLVLHARGRAALRDPVPWLMAALWLAYLAAIPLLFPDYLERMLPLVEAIYLDAGPFGWWEVIFTERLGGALALLLPLAVVALRQGATLPRVVALAGLGAAASAIVQHKGWTYHALPPRLFALLLGLLLAARGLDRLRPPLAPERFALAGAVALSVLAAATGEAPWREVLWASPANRDGALAALLERHAAGQGVLVLSPDIYPIYAALSSAGAENTLPTMNTWLLQGLYRRCPPGDVRWREPAAMGPDEALFYQTTVMHFASDPPAAILVADHTLIPPCGGQPFDILGYFARDRVFGAALRRYRPVAAVPGYRLLVRGG